MPRNSCIFEVGQIGNMKIGSLTLYSVENVGKFGIHFKEIETKCFQMNS